MNFFIQKFAFGILMYYICPGDEPDISAAGRGKEGRSRIRNRVEMHRDRRKTVSEPA